MTCHGSGRVPKRSVAVRALSIAVRQSRTANARRARSSGGCDQANSAGVMARTSTASAATIRGVRPSSPSRGVRDASTTPPAPNSHTNRTGISQSQSTPACTASIAPPATIAPWAWRSGPPSREQPAGEDRAEREQHERKPDDAELRQRLQVQRVAVVDLHRRRPPVLVPREPERPGAGSFERVRARAIPRHAPVVDPPVVDSRRQPGAQVGRVVHVAALGERRAGVGDPARRVGGERAEHQRDHEPAREAEPPQLSASGSMSIASIRRSSGSAAARSAAPPSAHTNTISATLRPWLAAAADES